MATIIAAPCPVKGIKQQSTLAIARDLATYSDYINASLPVLLRPEVKQAVLDFHQDMVRCFCCVVLSRRGESLIVAEIHAYSQRTEKSIGNGDKKWESYVNGYNMAFMIPVYIICNGEGFHCGIIGQPWKPVEELQNGVAAINGVLN